jgi:1-aminocyclopropane-1-carboxylate synthase
MPADGYSPKDFAGAGLRLGSIITQNSLLRKSLTAIFRFHNPSGVSVAIGTAILEDQDFVKSFISLSRERPSQAYRYATTTLAEAGISYHGGR